MPEALTGADDEASSAPELRPGGRSTRLATLGSPRALTLVAVVCGGIIVLGLVWILATGFLARARLQHAQADLPKLREALLSGDVTRARALAADIRSNAGSAHSLVSGPAWWVAANLPLVGTPLDTARDLASAAHRVGSDVLPGLVELAATVHGSGLRTGSTLHLDVLQRSEQVVDAAALAATRARATVDRSPRSSWLSPVDSARTSFSAQLDQLDSYLVGAGRTLHVALPMLGQDRPQRFFLAFLNEAEARGLGGLPGAFAIVETNHGAVTFTHFGNDSELTGVSTGLSFGADYAASYGRANPTNNYKNSDISPNFPFAGKIWATMWQKRSGQHVDGAIALDPTALGYLLKATGPAYSTDGTKITSANVVALTESEQYTRFPLRNERQKWVVQISKAISKRLMSGGEVTYLAKAVTRSARERRLLVWSADPALERQLDDAGFAGTVRATGSPFSGFAVTNASGSKLGYYLDRSVSYARTGCGANSTAVATLTITDNAPRSGLPKYVTMRGDTPPPGAVPGDDHVIIAYYSTGGSVVRSVAVNGTPRGAGTSKENGLTAVFLDLELKIGVPQKVTITTAEPAADGPVDIFRQPLIRPLKVTTSGSTCG